MLPDSHIKSQFLNPEEKGPLVLEAQGKTTFNPFEWVKENNSLLETYLLKHGGVLLRNFNIYSMSEFNRIVQIISPELLDYMYRSTPRTRLGGKIYTATEYPADRIIPLHNENAYSRSWPKKIFFFSIIVADEGGETPIADSRNVYKKIDPHIKNKFEEYGVMYTRNYTKGIDLNWQEVFQTKEKEKVEKYCQENEIEYEWKADTPELTTRQTCRATLVHPISGEPVWFNQAHLFHISSLDETSRVSLIKELGETNIPRNASYGNGMPFENEVLDHIREVYASEKVKFKWHKGDIMILDNILMAHGRESFVGERKVAVAMA
ncbi:MAG: TauD/TfdA family dioxygenase [Candidatus Paracaedibacteraceae bacterium]|nr:TauD/TfdA family dioxygenase [Candidatus Paracaedibacteraceae bacterium]